MEHVRSKINDLPPSPRLPKKERERERERETKNSHLLVGHSSLDGGGGGKGGRGGGGGGGLHFFCPSLVAYYRVSEWAIRACVINNLHPCGRN